MRIQLLLIRHGKTQGNLEGRYIGCRTDEPLSEEWISEALQGVKASCQEVLGDLGRVAGIRETVFAGGMSVYSSPMKRARMTAEVLFPGSELTIIDELTEIDFGDFENKNYDELNGNADYQKWIDSGGVSDYPGGEKRQDFIKRSMAGFYKVLAGMVLSNIDEAVIVCHGGNIMSIMSSLTGRDYFDFQVGNGRGYLLELEIEGRRVDIKSYSGI